MTTSRGFPVLAAGPVFQLRFERHVRRAVLSLAAVVTTGCHASNPVPFSEGLAVLEHDVSQAGPITLSDVDDPAGQERIRASIQAAQCLANSTNPLVPVISGAFTLQLVGQVQEGGGPGATVAAVPALPLTFGVQVQKGQEVTVPITFVALRTLPDFYLGQRLANFNGLGDSQKDSITKNLLTQRSDLQKLVNGSLHLMPDSTTVCKPIFQSLGKHTGQYVPPFSPQLKH